MKYMDKENKMKLTRKNSYLHLLVKASEIHAITDNSAKCEAVVDLLWDALSKHDVSWLGFYFLKNNELILGPREDKPSCSPIGLNGVCGKAMLEKKIQIVDDVHALGDAHIVCDPRNLSEIVLPLIDEAGECWGVLDLDSFVKSAFTSEDAYYLSLILEKVEIGKFAPS